MGNNFKSDRQRKKVMSDLNSGRGIGKDDVEIDIKIGQNQPGNKMLGNNGKCVLCGHKRTHGELCGKCYNGLKEIIEMNPEQMKKMGLDSKYNYVEDAKRNSPEALKMIWNSQKNVEQSSPDSGYVSFVNYHGNKKYTQHELDEMTQSQMGNVYNANLRTIQTLKDHKGWEHDVKIAEEKNRQLEREIQNRKSGKSKYLGKYSAKN